MTDWSIVKIKLKDVLYKIKENSIVDAAVKASIEEIPFIGNFLLALYENAPENDDEKYKQITKLIENLSELRQFDLKLLYDNIQANRKEILTNQNSLTKLVVDSTNILNIVKSIDMGQVSLRDGQEKIFMLLDKMREERTKDTRSILNELENIQINTMYNFDKIRSDIVKFDLNIPADQLLFYLHLLEHLTNSYEVFHNQNTIQWRLEDSLRKRQYTKPIEMGYDEFFYKTHSKMNDEEREMFNFLRRTTDDSKRFNSYARKLLQDNLEIFIKMNELEKLYEHYCYWLAKYQLLKDDPDMCLIYVGPKQLKRFPVGIESEINNKIKELRKETLMQDLP
jgi:hypothetical protein